MKGQKQGIYLTEMETRKNMRRNGGEYYCVTAANVMKQSIDKYLNLLF
jgi:hypothetical protein